MKATTRKLLSALLTLLMMAGVVAAAPVVTHAAPPAANTTWLFTSASPDETDVSYGGGTYSWVQSTKTLTLNNITHTTSAAIALHLDLDEGDSGTIVLIGENTVASTFSGTGETMGIRSFRELVITGDGSLDVTGGTKTNVPQGSYGINVLGGRLTINGSAVVNATGGTAPSTSYGILVWAFGFTVSGSAAVTATGGTSTNSFGFNLGWGDIVIDGGTFTAVGYSGALFERYTVPSGYKYYVNTTAEPSTTELISDGSVEVAYNTHKYVKIVYYVPVPPTITTTSLPNATVGVPYSVILAATGDTPINWRFAFYDDDWLVDYFWTTSSGFGGIPPVAGTFDITFKAVNDVGYDEKTLTLMVDGAPTITTTSLPNATVGVPYSVTLEATGDTPINWRFAFYDDDWLVDYFWTTSSGFGGIPPVAGTFDITFKAVNDAGYDEKTLTLVVNPAPTYNVAVSGGTGGGSYTAGQTVAITANAPASSFLTGQRFKEWTGAGVTFSNKNSASTTFTMPVQNVTVTAQYESVIRLWGKNTNYASSFLNWILCIVCFGWIWMAF